MQKLIFNLTYVKEITMFVNIIILSASSNFGMDMCSASKFVKSYGMILHILKPHIILRILNCSDHELKAQTSAEKLTYKLRLNKRFHKLLIIYEEFIKKIFYILSFKSLMNNMNSWDHQFRA